jgi:transposase-like protein
MRFDRQLRGQAAAVLKLIERYPGHTACELARRLGTDDASALRWRYAISRRAADLAKKHFVRKGSARVCEVTGTDQVTWYAV